MSAPVTPPTLPANRCALCRYFDGSQERCRIDPPRVLLGEEGLFETVWPEVDPDRDWCGRFDPPTPPARKAAAA